MGAPEHKIGRWAFTSGRSCPRARSVFPDDVPTVPVGYRHGRNVNRSKSLGVDPASVREWVKRFSDQDSLEPGREGQSRRNCGGCGRKTPDFGWSGRFQEEAAAFFAKEQS